MKWARFALLTPCWLLTVSASSPTTGLDVNEAGRVMAELDDWRALMFVMLFLIVLLVGALLWAFGKLSKAVESMVTLREAITALNSLAQSGAMDARDNRAILSRIESELARRQ